MDNYLCGSVSYNNARTGYLESVGNDFPMKYVKMITEIKKDSLPLRLDGSLSMDSGRRRRLWSHDEDIRLYAAIYYNGESKWDKIAAFVGNRRTSEQCLQRWKRSLKPGSLRGKFSRSEDEILLKLVEEYGTHSWVKVSLQLGSRTDVQCRCRYLQLSKKNKKKRIIPIEIEKVNPIGMMDLSFIMCEN